jgi:ribosome-associated heat shock protein Hsp15
VEGNRQRLDRWLWHARVTKTRSLAAALAASGYVRLNGKRIEAPGHAVRPGDVLTIAMTDSVRVLRIVDLAARRGGSEEAKGLYDDLDRTGHSRVGQNSLAGQKSVR